MRKRERSWQEKYLQLEADYKEALRKQQQLVLELSEFRCNYGDYKESRAEMLQLHENARKLKHDMRNHLMVLASYLNGNEILEAKQYASEILDKLNLEYSYIKTGNTLLNYIVNQKLSAAKQMGIYVKAEIENLRFASVQSIDFSALLGNLLDNALEAAAHSQKKYVELTIRQVRGYEVIKICNSIDDSVLAKNPKFNTTKNERAQHGVGLSQVRDIVEKYQGLLDIYEEEDRFIVSVMF